MIFIEFEDFSRLGNWMFQYATAISLHQEVRVVLACEYAKRKINDYLVIFKNIQIVDSVPSSVQVINYDPTMNNPIVLDNESDDVLLKGLFQSPRYFDESLVRRTFSPPEYIIEELNEKYRDWLKRPQITGIHVRRGDYLNLQFAHPFVGRNFLIEAINTIKECSDFIVCSDDIPWCKEFFVRQFPNKHFLFVENSTEVSDMFLMSRCKNNIISNGTFGWWGAWLNPNVEKKVIAPSLWFGYKLKQQGIKWNDFYYEGVTVLNNGYTLRNYIVAHFQYLERQMKIFLFPIYNFLKKII